MEGWFLRVDYKAAKLTFSSVVFNTLSALIVNSN